MIKIKDTETKDSKLGTLKHCSKVSALAIVITTKFKVCRPTGVLTSVAWGYI